MKRKKGPRLRTRREGHLWDPVGSLGSDIPLRSLEPSSSLHTHGYNLLRLSPYHLFGAASGQGSGGRKVPQQNLFHFLPGTESLYKYQPQQLLLSPLFSLLLLSPSSWAGRLQPLTFPWSQSLCTRPARWVPGAEMNHNLSLALQPAMSSGPCLTEQGRLSWPVGHINQIKPHLQTCQAASPSIEATECTVSPRAEGHGTC